MERRHAALLLCLCLAACGGGGGAGTPSESPAPVEVAPTAPNILLVITDDQGIDASGQYPHTDDPPTTPTIDALADEGLVYDNVWATPQCATTRACLITGKFGQENGVPRTPGLLDPSVGTLQEHLAADPATADYACGVFGKWHLSNGGGGADHPSTVGIDHYAGAIGNLDDYSDWTLTVNGASAPETSYHTSKITDLARDWIATQDGPWFAWLAYAAPHGPLHLPPAQLHSDDTLTGTAEDIQARPRAYYLAMLEALDAELGRLLDSLDPVVRANTVVLVIGDNGTPRTATDSAVYPNGHWKGTFYEGGLRVPLVVSGAGVTRRGQREPALITVTDFFATLAEHAGATSPVPSSSVSFRGTFTQAAAGVRPYAFAEEINDGVYHRAIRSLRYKLIDRGDGAPELYDLETDLREETNLLPGDAAVQVILQDLTAAMGTVR